MGYGHSRKYSESKQALSGNISTEFLLKEYWQKTQFGLAVTPGFPFSQQLRTIRGS